MNFFEEVLKGYNPQWEAVNVREFTDSEKTFMGKIVVHQGNYDRSIMFTGQNGKKYFIPIEKSSVSKYLSEMAPGATLDANRLLMVQLKYIGDDPNYKVKTTYKVRYTDSKDETPIDNFDDPFGLK